MSNTRLFVTLLAVGLSAGGELHGQPGEAEIRSVLAEMILQKHNFEPERLHEMGVDGLEAVLDELLPDTARPKKSRVPAEVTAGLIEQLGDESFRVREAASEELRRLGPGIRAALLQAAGSADVEVSWRATLILRGWALRASEDRGRYCAAFCVFATGISDDRRLEVLTRRTLQALQEGMPAGGRREILRQCMATIAGSATVQHVNRLGPLLGHDDVGVAVLATEAIGNTVSSDRCPRPFLQALRHQREEVAGAALSYAAGCAEGPHRKEVERALIEIFRRAGGTLKLRAAVSLMHTFRHSPARQYVLQQVETGDRERKCLALSFLGHPANAGKPADEELLEAVRPLLKPGVDRYVRRVAARALGVYSGRQVVQSLIPLLADEYSRIPREVKQSLLVQPDKEMVRRLLRAAAEEHSDEEVKRAAAEMLKTFNLRQ